MTDTTAFIIKAIDRAASDIFIRGNKVWLKLPDGVVPASSLGEFTKDEIAAIVKFFDPESGHIPKEYLDQLEYKKTVDFAIVPVIPSAGDVPFEARLRVHGFYSRGEVAYSIRLILPTPRSLEDLGIEGRIQERLLNARGLFLVTGPTGAGKSTSLAAILQYLSERKRIHLVTLEDPIEYIIHSDVSLIHQRELYKDFPTYPEGLRSVLRENPDVVMVGEVRDLETLRWVMALAESGFLVLATYHTRTPQETVEHIVGSFPESEQAQARIRLATSLVGVLSQFLLVRRGGTGGRGRVVAYEYFFTTPAISTLIREGKTMNLRDQIKAGNGTRFEETLARLVRTGMITREQAEASAYDVNLLREKLAVSG